MNNIFGDDFFTKRLRNSTTENWLDAL